MKLHSSNLYNGFQIGVSLLAVFSGGFAQGMQNPKCFVAGTMIMTASGLVTIENIKAGDKVISTDPETFETAEKEVLETYVRETTELVHLTINGEIIQTTYDHPFYVKDYGFVNAGELYTGDKLLDSSGNELIVEDKKVENLDEAVKVYNFQVEDFHTYYVSEKCVLVHNAGDLYQRGKFRKSTHEKALREAPKNKNGEVICPTCGKPIPKKISIQTKNGPKVRRGYDLDHYPSTWSERVKNMKMRQTPPTRKEVLDIYNDNVRIQCSDCNQGHLFEGIKGDFAK